MATAVCAPKPPDYQSILSKTPTTTTTTSATAKPVPLSQYLQSIGVTGQQVAPASLPDLTVSTPTPPGWAPFSSPNISPQTVMISKGGKFPTARLVVFKLSGDFDLAQVIKHGNDDAQLFENFKQLDASGAPYNGFPSSMIQGSYDLDGMRLHSWNRIVIATGSPRRISAIWSSSRSPAWPIRPPRSRPASRRSSMASWWRRSSRPAPGGRGD